MDLHVGPVAQRVLSGCLRLWWLLWVLWLPLPGVAAPEAPTTLEATPEWVEVAEIPAQWSAAMQEGSGWRYWLVDAQMDMRTDAGEAHYDYAYEATTSERLGEAGRYEISFRAEYQSIALHRVEVRRAGVWESRFKPESLQLAQRQTEFEADTDDQEWSLLIVLDDVRVEDVVRISYSIRGRNPVLAGMTHAEFGFSSSVPIAFRRARVLYDPDSELDTRPHNAPPEPVLTRTDAALIWSAVAENVAASPAEADTPEHITDRPTWMLAARRSWKNVADWAVPLYAGRGELPADLLQRLDPVRAQPKADRVRWALALVQDEVRYHLVVLGDSSHRPHPVDTIWQRRMGDCKDKSVLLVALLRELGVDASPALVSVSLRETIADRPPSATVFDHVIVRANVAGQHYWLDPTLTLQRGPLDSRRAGDYGLALVVAPGSEALTPMPASLASADRTEIDEHFSVVADSPGALALKVTTTYEGAAANRFRRSYATEGAAATAKRFLTYYRGVYEQAESAAELAVEDNEDRNRIVIHEHYRLEKPWTLSGRGQTMPLSASQLLENVNEPTPGERKFPFLAASMAELSYRATLTLPDDWTAERGPYVQKAASDAFEWQSRQQVSATALTIEHRLVGKQRVIPADATARHYEAVRQARLWSQAEIAVIPPAVKRIESREQRLRAILRALPRAPGQAPE